MTNKVIGFEFFDQLFEELDQDEKEWIQKMIRQLEQSLEVGKPLRGKWLKEKKYKNKRLYFIVYEEYHTVLLISFSTKKEQDKEIDLIVLNKEKYRQFVQKSQ